MFESLENRQHMSATLLTPSVPIPPPVTTTTTTTIELQHEDTHVKETVPWPSDWQGYQKIFRSRT
jgi:hypothetical protein